MSGLKMLWKRILPLCLALLMVLGSSVTALATPVSAAHVESHSHASAMPTLPQSGLGLSAPVRLPSAEGALQAPRSILISTAMTIGKNAFLGYKLLRGAVAGGESWKRGGSITDVAADAISGFTGLRISNVDVREMYVEIQKQFDDVHTQLGDLAKSINEMSAAIEDLKTSLDKLSAEIVINQFKPRYVNAYTAINREYLDLHAALQDPNADHKAAYDELYVAALEFYNVVYPYLIGTGVAGDESILEIMYRYATSTESPEGAVASANLVAQDIYGAYVFAEYCLMTCELYQANYCLEKGLSQYSYAAGQSTHRDRYGALLEEAGARQIAANNLLCRFLTELNLDNSYLYNPSASALFIEHPAVTASACTGDRLYLYAMPELLEGVFNPDGFTFRTSDPALATVSPAGVVEVLGETGSRFSVSLCYRAGDGAEEIELYRFDISIVMREFSGGFGTAEAPYVISTADDFENIIGDYVWYKDQPHVFALYNDINMGGVELEPLDRYPFKGTLEGNGFAVYNFKVPEAFFDEQNTGLFCVNEGTIRNLRVGKNGFVDPSYGKSVSVAFDGDRAAWDLTDTYVGVLCGQNKGTISGCVVENVLIERVLTEQDDNRHNTVNVGAIAGLNEGTITRCLVSNTTVKAVMNATEKSSDDNGARAGGLVAVMTGGSLTNSLIIDSSISATAHASGVKVILVTNKASAYAAVGGLVGKQSGGDVSRCFAYNLTLSSSAVGDNTYCETLEALAGGLSAETTGGTGSGNLAAASSNTWTNRTSGGLSGTWYAKTADFLKAFAPDDVVFVGADQKPRVNFAEAITLTYDTVKTQYRKNESFNPVGISVGLTDALGAELSGNVPFFRLDASGFGANGGSIRVSSYGGFAQSFEAKRTCDHVWGEGRVTVESTHTANGTRSYTCSECGDTKLETLPTVPHSFDRRVLSSEYLAVDATCLAPASYYYSCSCGAKGTATFSDDESGVGAHRLQHFPGDAADCTKDVTLEHFVCRTCERIFLDLDATEEVTNPDDLIVKGTGHTYLSRDFAPTCTENGYTQHICSRCGHEYRDNYRFAEGHDEVIDAAVAATCTEDGLTAGKHCATCLEVLTPQTVIPAKGHTIVIQPGKRVTCTENGLTEGRYCSVCHEVLAVQTEIIAKGHVQVIDPMRAPTCTEVGLTEGSHCSACGYVYVAQNEIAAKGHVEVNDAAVDPTCTQNGLTAGRHCMVCGSVTLRQEPIAALGHKEAVDAAVPATCTESGLSQGKHCTVCFAVTLAQNVVPALGHTELISSAVAPTCLQSGLTEGRRCNVCGVVTLVQTSIPATGHREVTDAAVAPTCTESGLTEGSHCENCRQVFVVQVTIPATGHGAISDWVTVTPPAVGVEGLRQKVCTVCGEALESETIEALLPESDSGDPSQSDNETDTNGDITVTVSGCGAMLGGSPAFMLLLLLFCAAYVLRPRRVNE